MQVNEKQWKRKIAIFVKTEKIAKIVKFAKFVESVKSTKCRSIGAESATTKTVIQDIIMQVNPPVWPENPLSHQMKHNPGGKIYQSDKSELCMGYFARI